MAKYVNPAQFGQIDPNDWAKYEDHYTQVIWPGDLPSKPSDYGTPGFHGRTHPEIIKVALLRYTRPGDVVWDCFAGGGTTIDVCAELGRFCVANDILPVRENIIKADSRRWRPDVEVDLVIMHPPYMDIIDWPGSGSLSVGCIEDYVAGMREVLNNVTPSLRMHHVLVLIVGQVYKDSVMYPLDCELYPLLYQYRLLGRVVRGYGETQGGETAGNKKENLWKYRRFQYGIWALGIDSVLFLQRTL